MNGGEMDKETQPIEFCELWIAADGRVARAICSGKTMTEYAGRYYEALKQELEADQWVEIRQQRVPPEELYIVLRRGFSGSQYLTVLVEKNTQRYQAHLLDGRVERPAPEYEGLRYFELLDKLKAEGWTQIEYVSVAEHATVRFKRRKGVDT